MKVISVLCIWFLIFQQYSNADLGDILSSVVNDLVGDVVDVGDVVVPLCMTLSQINTGTSYLCGDYNITALWQGVIDCHRPISDEAQGCLDTGHPAEVLQVDSTSNPNVPCNIGTCIKSLFKKYDLDLGL